MTEIDPNSPMVVASGTGVPSRREVLVLLASTIPPGAIIGGPQRKPKPEPEPKAPQTEIEIWNAAVEAKKKAKKEAKS